MKPKKNHYLFLLRSPSAAAALSAWNMARELNLYIAGQTGDIALELLATPEEAERFFELGMFSAYSSRRLQPKFFKESTPELIAVIESWNSKFSAAYRKRKKDLSKKGLKWGAKGLQEPAPYTRVDPGELIRVFIEIRRKKKLPFEAKSAKASLKLSKEVLDRNDRDTVREFIRKHIPVEKDADDLFRVFSRVKKNQRFIFLDWEWLKDLWEALLHLLAAQEPGCLQMHGRNSVGIVFVDSSQRDGPKFTATKRNEIEQEIRSGLSFLVSEHPSGNLTWVFNVQQARINVADQPNQSTVSSAFDEYWRHPAMTAFSFEGHSFTGDTAGIDSYREAMRAHNQSQHSTVIFVSAFGMSWHAYSVGNRFIAMGEHGNDWGNWGQDELNITTAHEMSHQFGAADEYSGSGTPCDSCGGSHGCDNIPNGNCESCADPSQGCIMQDHSLNICQYTRGQIGWSDLFVELWTSSDWWSGTDDSVEIDIGERTFTLDIPDHDDRENGAREGYAIWAGGNLDRKSIKRILIRKSSDGFSGGWKLHRVKVRHEGQVISDKTPDTWLEDRKTWFLADVFDTALVNILKLKVSTADAWWAGTDDDVTLKLAGRSWNIDSDDNDFESGASKTYELDPQTGVHVSDLHTIVVKKSPDGVAGGWKLKGLKLTVNGNNLYENNSINQWLEDNNRTFSDNI